MGPGSFSHQTGDRDSAQIRWPPATPSQTGNINPDPGTNLAEESLVSSGKSGEVAALERMQLVYHFTPLRNVPWILRHGLLLSTSTWTVSSVPLPTEKEDMPVFAVYLPRDWLIPGKGIIAEFFIKPTCAQPEVTFSPEFQRFLERLDRFYLPQDAGFSTTAKPEFLRMAVSRAHNLLENQRQNTLVKIPASQIDLDATLRCKENRKCEAELRKMFEEYALHNGALPALQPTLGDYFRDRALDLLGAIYPYIPKWETRAFRRHNEMMAMVRSFASAQEESDT